MEDLSFFLSFVSGQVLLLHRDLPTEGWRLLVCAALRPLTAAAWAAGFPLTEPHMGITAGAVPRAGCPFLPLAEQNELEARICWEYYYFFLPPPPPPKRHFKRTKSSP